MGGAENTLPPSKKRVAGRELSRDNPGLDDEEDAPEQEMGTFKRASDEVLATRRIVKVRRHQPTSAASSNPFASICLVPPTQPSSEPASVIPKVQPTEPSGEKDASEGVDEKGTVDKETVEASVVAEPEGEVKNNQHSENKSDEPEVEPEGEGKNNQHSENKSDEPEVEPTADKEKETPAAEATKPETNDKNTKPETNDENEAAAGEETENEPKKENSSGNTSPAVTAETEKEAEKDHGHENTPPAAATAPLSSFQQLSSSQNAFTGLAGTGFSSSSFTFGSIPKDAPAFSSSSGSLFGMKNDKSPSFTSFSFGNSNNGNSSLFGAAGASNATKGEGSNVASMQEVPVETGEENEKAVFTADAILFEYLDGGWKERGKGELKVNVSTTGTEKARLIMRARGNYRLILNANLYPDMKLTNMDKRGVTFACVNSTGEGKDGLSTFALKLKDGSIVEEFRASVTAHKGKMTAVLKTPENSPKASDD
ncbi:PREDICTED: nuclear pore complex protein NUP50A-like [Nelumbo nucifera]|uniref:Nuclear pore complex protein NUP50A-like n=1 Tax=Nelumbo nucifera TaxID=4432 RepID=A0A1U7ZEM7_NELNU|nr:PREDICTED: nuclear pore complex protein NUP50A-like [Nelumbo nucifera]